MENKETSKRGIWGWMLFDWAAQPFHTVIITFIFAPYFASHVAADSITGQAQWGYAAAIAGVLIAVFSPILGSIADATGPRKPWIAMFSVLAIVGSVALWWAYPNTVEGTSVVLVLGAFVVTMLGFEFAAVFNNAMMPDLVPRADIGRLSGNAWALGYVAGLLTLIIVLVTMATNDKGRDPDRIATPVWHRCNHEGRGAGHRPVDWIVVSDLCSSTVSVHPRYGTPQGDLRRGKNGAQ